LLNCPLCFGKTRYFHSDPQRDYHRCVVCLLIFADPASHLSAEKEKAVYDQHQNSPDDVGYRRFLSRLTEPLLPRLRPGDNGLDFGCGPGPTLALMLTESGNPCVNYDPYYRPDVSLLDRQYDFVTCSEVVEHFNQPRSSWRQLLQLVRPGGWLAVMTKRASGSPEAFSRWHYKNDPTHVVFYGEATFAYLARQGGFSLEFAGADVVLMQSLGGRPGKPLG